MDLGTIIQVMTFNFLDIEDVWPSGYRNTVLKSFIACNDIARNTALVSIEIISK